MAQTFGVRHADRMVAPSIAQISAPASPGSRVGEFVRGDTVVALHAASRIRIELPTGRAFSNTRTLGNVRPSHGHPVHAGGAALPVRLVALAAKRADVVKSFFIPPELWASGSLERGDLFVARRAGDGAVGVERPAVGNPDAGGRENMHWMVDRSRSVAEFIDEARPLGQDGQRGRERKDAPEQESEDSPQSAVGLSRYRHGRESP